ncbi:ADP-ribosylglycohydrolase family protein, partial [Lacticaseibacillus paracasei]
MGIMESRLIHGTVGFAIGDALGLPVKGQNAAELTAAPVTTMKGYGTFNQPAGTYSDETGLALAGLDALQHGFDEQALIKAYQAWFTAGKYAPYGKRSPDIWPSIETALKTGQSVASPKEPGALIRILPFAFFAYQTFDTSLFQKA